MKLKHTQGPWEYQTDGKDDYYIINSGKGYHIRHGDCIDDGGFHVAAFMSKANALLIAAAPEMLEALVESLKFYGETIAEIGGCDHSIGICICDIIRDADNLQSLIEKATGLSIDEILNNEK